MRPLAPLLLLTAVTLLGAAPAAADVEQVVSGLRAERLYVAPTADISLDRDAVLGALEESAVPTYVAVVPQSEADAEELGIDGLLLRIVEGLEDPRAVVLVVTDGQELQAGEGGLSGVDPGSLLDQVLVARLDEPFTPATLTSAVLDFTERVNDDARSGPASSGPTRREVGLVGLVAVAALGGGGWLYVRGQRRVLAPTPLTAQARAEQRGGWRSARRRE